MPTKTLLPQPILKILTKVIIVLSIFFTCATAFAQPSNQSVNFFTNGSGAWTNISTWKYGDPLSNNFPATRTPGANDNVIILYYMAIP